MLIKFLELNRNFQERMCTVPQAVFTTLNPDDETNEQIISRQDRFLELSEAIKDKLISAETSDKIKAIGKHYNLELLQLAPIARVIRSYYFGEVKLENFANIIEKESRVSREDSENIARYVIERIIQTDVKNTPVSKIEKMNISKAMETYPEIKNQKLTSYSIEKDGQLVAPTIGEWIRDYHSAVGAGNRDIMKRSSYLYHSKNVKNLNVTDRQKLSAILKSLDAGLIIKVDTDKKEVIFDLSPVENKGRFTMPSTNVARNTEDAISQYKTEKTQIIRNNSPVTINHVQGNNLDLRSSYFKNENEKKSGLGFLMSNKKRADFDNKKEVIIGEEEGLKFSSPQQLPVEKESNKSTNNNDFFSKIRPIE